MTANELYNEHKNLVRHWVGRYAGLCNERADVDANDLFQSGCLGLFEAAKTYRPDLGSWGTWASFYIRKKIRETLGLSSSKYFYSVTLPDGKAELRRYSVGSLDAPAYADDDIALIDTIADENPVDFDTCLYMDDDARRVREAVNDLKNPKAREAIQCKYFSGKTYAEVAIEMGVDYAQARRWIREGLRHLRKDKRIRAISRERSGIDDYACFYAHKGVKSFFSSGSSVVEDIVFRREEIQNNMRDCRVLI